MTLIELPVFVEVISIFAERHSKGFVNLRVDMCVKFRLPMSLRLSDFDADDSPW